MRKTLLLGACKQKFVFLACLLAMVLAGACQEQISEPVPAAVEATGSRQSAVLTPSANLRAITEGRTVDVLPFSLEDAIDENDYVCPASTPVIDIANNAIQEIIDDPAELLIAQQLIGLAADVFPEIEALLFLEEDRRVEYGYNGEFTNQLNRIIKALRRFWNISSDEINVVPMKGSMLQDVERVAAMYQSPLVFSPPFSEAQALILATQVRDLLNSSDLLNGGDHPLFSFNAFAFRGIASVGVPPKVVMGDAIMNAYDELGFGDVAPQGILGHEWAHHVQFQKGYFDDDVPSLDPAGPDAAEETRYTELMADAMSAYFLTHKRGAAMNRHRVEQFLEVFFQIGDCAFANPGHHGTPNQRMAAAQFGFDLADAAHKQGHIMTAEEVHDLFVDVYFDLIAPDA